MAITVNEWLSVSLSVVAIIIAALSIVDDHWVIITDVDGTIFNIGLFTVCGLRSDLASRLANLNMLRRLVARCMHLFLLICILSLFT